LRGAGDVVDAFRKAIESHGLEQKVGLKGSFCMERCTLGVTVKIGDRVFTQVHREDVEKLFRDEVLPIVEAEEP